MEQQDFNPNIGAVVALQEGLRRIVAPNPSPMTFRGTNTYLLGHREIAVIDPGPASDAHLDAILAACRPNQTITHILVTHSHVDHSPLSALLSKETGAPILAFGPSNVGQSDAMKACLASGMASGGEGIDVDFQPDVLILDQSQIQAGDQRIKAHHTPGHMGNHMCFAWDDVVFCGDLVMGWASSLVSPPDGDLTDFMTSCEKLNALKPRIMHAGHGAPITAPVERIEWLIAHRKSRETQILAALSEDFATARALAEAIYTETPTALIPAATRNVFAHLIDLEGRKLVSRDGIPNQNARFSLVGN
ncbi:MBL fold metallo-hydrolase [Planktotalea sp.]|uniref:MBL fold metallo-hydrolase n=1 Tax=Planktotalea sp. TaxID=2029877 RepID=UPI0025F35DCF|nr:MBL fold metallo-hydrolase [Planktotalea sp.]